eukprot:2899938-Amphidinium_carterae.1
MLRLEDFEVQGASSLLTAWPSIPCSSMLEMASCTTTSSPEAGSNKTIKSLAREAVWQIAVYLAVCFGSGLKRAIVKGRLAIDKRTLVETKVWDCVLAWQNTDGLGFDAHPIILADWRAPEQKRQLTGQAELLAGPDGET